MGYNDGLSTHLAVLGTAERGENMFEALLEKIRQYDTIILHRHFNPDGDALGSQIGLKHILKAAFPEKNVYMVGDEAGRYAFMEDSVMDTIPDETYPDALAILLDTAARKLISDERYHLARETARVDHHLVVEKIADTEVLDPSFESCCGMIAFFARECGLPVPPLAAASLFTGLVTDSGRFRFDAVTARTFELAGFLLEKGIDTSGIYRELYATDLEQLKWRARFIQKIRVTPQGVAYIYTPLQEMEETGLGAFGVSRGMANVMADIRGVDVWVNFTETPEGVLCELRSSRYNIQPVAVKYGGGGHEKASGARVRDREEAMRMLEDLNAVAGGKTNA